MATPGRPSVASGRGYNIFYGERQRLLVLEGSLLNWVAHRLWDMLVLFEQGNLSYRSEGLSVCRFHLGRLGIYTSAMEQ